MFKGNVPVYIYGTKMDKFSQKRKLARTLRAVKSRIVRQVIDMSNTSLRPDISASKSFAIEQVSALVLQLPPDTTLDSTDLIEVNGITYEITSIEFKFTALGRMHHKQVTGEIWASK